jgi:protein gp37
MAIKTNISWAESTVNFFINCKKISEGCKFCYMFRITDPNDTNPTAIRRAADSTFYKPLTWLDPRLIFTCSMSDFFLEEVDQWRADAWDIIRRTPQHHWLILTKRPERILSNLPIDWGDGYDNVSLGVSVENQKRINRITTLSQVPSRHYFVSIEPILEKVVITQAEGINKIGWIIIGGESGNEHGKYRYRPAEIEWFTSLIEECRNLGIKVFNKQLGTFLAKKLKLKSKHGDQLSEWHKSLQVQEQPNRFTQDQLRELYEQYKPKYPRILD